MGVQWEWGLRINNLDLAIPLEFVNTRVANLVNPMGQWNLISDILWVLDKL